MFYFIELRFPRNKRSKKIHLFRYDIIKKKHTEAQNKQYVGDETHSAGFQAISLARRKKTLFVYAD